MTALRLVVGGILVLALPLLAGAQDKEGKKDKSPKKPPAKVDKATLLGKWRQVNAPKGKGGLTVEITKDGKAILATTAAAKDKGKKAKIEKTVWSYEIDGNTVKLSRKVKDKEEPETRSITVTRLDKRTLVAKDEKGTSMEFMRLPTLPRKTIKE